MFQHHKSLSFHVKATEEQRRLLKLQEELEVSPSAPKWSHSDS